jgi:GrpB-like predicted nucleotidyltransferase (UPF0157 family)
MGLTRNIVVVEYKSEWPEEFAAESRQLNDTLASVLTAIHHIGSTSVPGLAAKPIIDILAVVRNLDELDSCNDAMTDLGYEPKGEFGIVGRRFFAKGGDADRTHHVHAYEAGHLEIGTHLGFRDYLRVHSDQAVRYAELKAKLAERYRNDIEAYMAGKAPFIIEILDKAWQWRKTLDDGT